MPIHALHEIRGGLVAVITGAFVGALFSVSGGVMAAANTGNTGPDLTAIASFLLSIAGLVSAVAALIAALKRRGDEQTPKVIIVHDDEVEHQPAKRKRRAS